MKIFGITSSIDENCALFFYDYDNVSLYDVIEDCNVISQTFDIDIYILQSSKNSFHAISFDILTKDMCSRIQNYVGIDSDYINIKDVESLMYNILRLGYKGSKPSPNFIKVLYSKENTHLKSLRHYNVYRTLCKIPLIPERLKRMFINCSKENLVLYNSHKHEYKGVIRKKWIM